MSDEADATSTSMSGLKVVKKGDRVIKEYVDVKTGKIAVYEPGIKLEVSDFKGTWYPAKVLEVDHEENEVLVHYDKWSSRFDEWIKTDSNRLRPCPDTNQVKIQFKIGERVEALWSNDGQKYPGTIKAVHPNDYYEVLFDDGIKCKKKVTQIFKIQRITRGRAAKENEKKSGSRSRGTPSVVSSSAEDSNDGMTPSGRRRRFRSGEESSGKASKDLTANVTNSLEESLLREETKEVTLDQASGAPASDSQPIDSSVSPTKAVAAPGSGSHHSIFEPVTTELGKRKRAYHDYSLFLKVPKKTMRTSRPDGERRRRTREPEERTVDETKESEQKEQRHQQQQQQHPSVEEQYLAPSTGSDSVKRPRKFSLKAETAAAATAEDSPRRRVGRRKSTVLMDTTGGDNTAGSSSDMTESGFIDEQGNAVEIAQTEDGGWICPVENCGKVFRKDSLLQMHLKHYHPESKIKYLGKKMNVFEMAIAKARRGSNEEDLLAPSSPEQILKARRRSSPVTTTKPVEEVIIEPPTPDIPKPEEPSVSDKEEDEVITKQPTAVTPKISTDVCVLLEKINLSNYSQAGSSSSSVGRPSRVSQRGRILPPRRWGRVYSDVESADEDGGPGRSSDDEVEYAPSPGRRRPGRASGSSRRSVAMAPDSPRKKVRKESGGGISGGIEESEMSSGAAEAAATALPSSAEDTRKNYRRLLKQGSYDGPVVPRGPGRPPNPFSRRNKNKFPKSTLLCGMKAKKLELIRDALLEIDRSKKVVAKPRFEDVKVDVINCECGLEEEFGLMMQCELCQAWQHGNCYDIFEVTQLPPYYVCSFCRDPKNLRQSCRHDWYQEVNTTGRLPRFSFTSPNDPEVEDRMTRSNDLLNCLRSVESLLRSTQMKITLLNSAEDNPKLVLWSKEQENPLKAVRREDFRLNYRAVLRQLIKQHARDPDYISRLRKAVQERNGSEPTVTTTATTTVVDDAVKKRLNARAWQMILEDQARKNGNWPPTPTVNRETFLENPTTDEMFSVLDDMELGKVAPDEASLDNALPSNSSTNNTPPEPKSEPAASAEEEESVGKLSVELENKLKEGKYALVEQGDEKFVILTRNWRGKSRQKVRAIAPAGGPAALQGSLGVGKAVDPIQGLEGLNLVQLEDSKAEGEGKPTVEFEALEKLRFCKNCKRSLSVNWSRKDFVRDSGLFVTSVPEELVTSCDERQCQPDESQTDNSNNPDNTSPVQSLKVLCQNELSKSHTPQQSRSITGPSQFQSSPVPVHRKITAKTCRSNLQAAIIREQALLDMHLDQIEHKLNELEKLKRTNPQAALSKLKDLEELRKKVQLINDSVEFMRKVGKSGCGSEEAKSNPGTSSTTPSIGNSNPVLLKAS